MRFEKAGRHLMNRQLASAWNSWWAGADEDGIHMIWSCFQISRLTFHHLLGCRMTFHLECKRQGDLLSKAAGRMKNLKLASAFYKWYDLILEKREGEKKLKK